MNANSERIEISRDLLEKAEKARSVLLLTKSELKYKKEYDKFLQWMEVNRMDSKNTSETVMLAYFQEMSELYSPNSLWTKWSMLKLMMRIHDDIDGSKFHELEAFLKRKSKGYEPKKSKVFSREDIVKFLKNASDQKYLLHKVVLIMGYFGGCRCQELLNMKINHIEDRGSVMVVDIPESKTDIRKRFTIVEENECSALSLVRKYMLLRPSGPERFFLTYRGKRCSVQPVGKNTFGKIPSKIASFLELSNPEAFTGHCLRRTSATALVNAGANMTTLKRHGGWRSSTVAEGYLADSMELKNKTARMLAGMSDERRETTSCLNTVINSDNRLIENPCNSGNNFNGKFDKCRFIFVNTLEGVKDL
ncbi:uncharacterized protein LOC123671465 [Harmonia axyridis]|uniref:uncharacterized protein LOC123671465 n=1 Tax=Harmonia axyridis TaxID=115357 RepID=UPI001E2765C5|nr:uncharacterized protein LOC123671465 [Harmonia axyridis]